MIQIGSVSGSTVYWILITGIGLLLSGGALLELRRRGKPVGPLHLIAGALTVAGFAALGYSGVWRSFYQLERNQRGLRLTYHWPSRHVAVPWDSIERINTVAGYKGQRPLRIVARNGREYVSAMIPAGRARQLSQCLGAELARYRTGAAAADPVAGVPDPCP